MHLYQFCKSVYFYIVRIFKRQYRTNQYVVYHITPYNKWHNNYQYGYIGVSKNFSERKRKHLSHLERNTHCNHKLKAAWLKHGNLKFTIIKICKTEHDMYEAERCLRPKSHMGWNIRRGGK